jgi:hypothetical protein
VDFDRGGPESGEICSDSEPLTALPQALQKLGCFRTVFYSLFRLLTKYRRGAGAFGEGDGFVSLEIGC